MQEAADRIIRSYSGGMKRRLDLASALVHEPQVLFLDEPTTGLDPASRQSVWEEVRRINRAGTTVFLTTQYLEEADQLCDRLAIIDGGRIVREGTPDSLKSSLGSDSVSLGVSDPQGARQALQGFAGIRSSAVDAAGLTVHCDDGAAAVPGIVQRIAAAGIALRTVTVKRPTLDDVFMAATGRHILEEDQRA
jgi:ABC-2 type transport system ATP-binding protein